MATLGRPSKRLQIVQFLKQELSQGREQSLERLISRAESRGVCRERTLQKAMEDLVSAGAMEKTGFGRYRMTRPPCEHCGR